MSKHLSVRVWTEFVNIPTYMPAAPDLNPMFLEKRVYQGSSGRVYPLPFTDRIADAKIDRAWTAVWLENKFLQIMILPEIGGRIHIARDKTNGYDFIYRQNVIKPALVGLAGPWISGGIEFNWPQHHRPATFLPADFHIEEHPDGSKTVWLSDHDPLTRMKGMHGVCLHPDRAVLELKVRAYNRTTLPQTFLWWANAGIRVHEAYQSFFPPDVHYVADHARRSTCEYPLCQGSYYGVNYGERARHGVPADERPANFVPPHCGGGAPVDYPPNDLSWYANIPTPCSYMCMGTKEDFFGGYDHNAQAGIVHVADHRIAPGKKQWTWGNHAFGYAWDRNLTDSDGPYIELMAGVYTDNQPDFSYLQPGETRTWSQFWYPIQKIGVAQHANVEAALHLSSKGGAVRVGVSVAREFPQAIVRLEGGGQALEWKANLAPGHAFVKETDSAFNLAGATLRVLSRDGREIIAYSPQPRPVAQVPPPATEPPSAAAMASADELYVTGLHLEQYRHATRCPTVYWREALRRDPFDIRCNNAMGLWHLRRGEFDPARAHFEKAIARATRRNPNPRDGEIHYNLGLCLCHLEQWGGAQEAFYKATWNQGWQSPAFHALAELACRRQDWTAALALLDKSLRAGADNNRARNLRAIVLNKLERTSEARAALQETLALDPLDGWANYLSGHEVPGGVQMRLDLALDFAQAGLYDDAIALLRAKSGPSKNGQPASLQLPTFDWGTAPLVNYYLGWLQEKAGQKCASFGSYRAAAEAAPDYCFPARLEEIAILQAALAANPKDARAAYYLGNLYYDRRRHEDAIRLWEQSAKIDPSYPVVWRNLGMACFNIAKNPRKARAAYDRAFRAKPGDARLLYERDQLWKRLGESPQKRLRELERHRNLIDMRDDLSIELCALYNQAGRHEKALAIISRRHFQPWEGGEGQALGQHVRTHLALGRRALARGDAPEARARFEAALSSPENLGEAKHLLANQSDIYYWLGTACAALQDQAAARKFWLAAATFRGDFQQMSTRLFSEMTYYSALAWGRLGRPARMKKLLRALLDYARQLGRGRASIDYFATSLPTMLLFDEDIQQRQETTALFLQAQALMGLGKTAAAKKLLAKVLQRDPNHAPALDL